MIQRVTFGGKPGKTSLTKAGTTGITVPTGHRYCVYQIGGSYVADATVVTRTFTVYMDTGGSTVEIWLGYLSSITASQTKRVNGCYSATGLDLCMGLPAGGLVLEAGHRLLTGVGNAQAGDTWSLDLLYWDETVL